MSDVTDVLIMANGPRRDEEAAIAFLNEWLAENADGQELAQIDLGKAGGHKVVTVDLFAGAFNYLDDEGLADAITRAPWECPEAVVAYFQNELLGQEGRCFVASPGWRQGSL